MFTFLHDFHPLQTTKFTGRWGHFAKSKNPRAVLRWKHPAVWSASYFTVNNKPCNIPFYSTGVYWVSTRLKLSARGYSFMWFVCTLFPFVFESATGMFPGVGISLSARFLLNSMAVSVCYCVTYALTQTTDRREQNFYSMAPVTKIIYLLQHYAVSKIS